MGLVLGLGLMAALGGAWLSFVCFDEARRLRRLHHRLPAACFGLGAAVSAAIALGGAWLVWSIAGAFLL